MGKSLKIRRRVTAKKIFRYFIQGIIILAPIGITAYALYWLFEKVDGILRPAVHTVTGVNIPGLGFVIILLFVILVGWISSNFLMGSAINFFDQWMERTPVIKFIYSSTKDFFEAFAGDKKKFNKAVLANIFSQDVWIVGFLTDEELQKFEMGADKVAVYVPQAYNFAGQLYILPRDRVRKIENITSGEAMKYAVTGGVVDLDAERDAQTRSELKTDRE
ncbi:MAG: DUF502 domain-containing protein [Chitinophagaceae bacterium]|nr:DUF502 domain-containing protein [Chitinophagaceae bacterium]